MAAVGILAALRERERSGEGQLVDVSMTDGALSWLAMVVARYFCEARFRGAASSSWPAAPLLLPLRGRATAGSRSARSSRSSGATGARASGRADLIEEQFEHPGSEAGGRSRRIFQSSARETSGSAFADEHDCCLEPVLDLDEALDSELVRAREMVVELDQPGARPGAAARLPGQALAHARRDRAARRRRSASTPTRCCASAGYADEEIAALIEPAPRPARSEAQQGSLA